MSAAEQVLTRAARPRRQRTSPWRLISEYLPGWASRLGLVAVLVFLALGTVGRLVGDPNALVTLGAEAPSLAHPFGTDNLGRDVFARTAHGAWTSLVICVGSLALALLIACPLGVLAGYHHGSRGDGLVMRFLESLQALPQFVFIMFIISILGPGPLALGPVTIGMAGKLIICLAIGFIPFFARVARAVTISEMQEDYIAGLRGIGVPAREIMAGELSVNVLPAVLVQALLAMAIAIFAEGGLSFLGMGMAPPNATLGNLIADAGSQILEGTWWYAVLPGLVMVIGILGFNLVGDALNDTVLGSRRSSRKA